MSITPEGELVRARFVDRPNRFVVRAETEDGEILEAHCPNPGRLEEFLVGNTPYLLRKRPDASPDQATQYSIVAARDGRFHVDSDRELGEAPEDPDFHHGAWTVLDTQVANRLVEDALEDGRLTELAEPPATYRTEPRVDHGRFDFAIEEGEGVERMVEVKSVTLMGEDGRTGLFPDAPTERGVRHVEALAERARNGEPATLFFASYRTDARQIAPNAATDPDFARALRQAREAGVQVVARDLVVSKDWRFALGEPIPVLDVETVGVGGMLEGDG